MKKEIYIESIGNVHFRRERRYVRMSMRVTEEGQVIVNVPLLVSYRTAVKWVTSKSNWIQKSKEKIKTTSKNTVFTFGMTYKTYKHTLSIVEGKFSKKGDSICIGLPPSITSDSITRPNVQASIRKVIDEVYTQEAKEILPKRVCELADEFGFQFNKLSFRNNKSRWGSCSGNDNISLNIHLMRLPTHLIEYVILHELAHTVEKNHSKSFWDLLETVCPKSYEYRKELREYSTTVY